MIPLFEQNEREREREKNCGKFTCRIVFFFGDCNEKKVFDFTITQKATKETVV